VQRQALPSIEHPLHALGATFDDVVRSRTGLDGPTAARSWDVGIVDDGLSRGLRQVLAGAAGS